MGWQFTLAEWIGGLVLIAIMTFLVRLTYPKQLVEEARRHVDAGGGHDHGTMDAPPGPLWRGYAILANARRGRAKRDDGLHDAPLGLADRISDRRRPRRGGAQRRLASLIFFRRRPHRAAARECVDRPGDRHAVVRVLDRQRAARGDPVGERHRSAACWPYLRRSDRAAVARRLPQILRSGMASTSSRCSSLRWCWRRRDGLGVQRAASRPHAESERPARPHHVLVQLYVLVESRLRRAGDTYGVSTPPHPMEHHHHHEHEA